MMLNQNNLHPEFIIDASGHRVSAVIPIAVYEALLSDLAAVKHSREASSISDEAVSTELKADPGRAIENIQWFHKVRLDDGRVTPGVVDIAKHESLYLFDRLDFRGKSVLDIGSWDGYFSFMAEKRGARRVLSLDNPDFRWGGLDGYNFLHDYFRSQAEWRKGSIYHLPEERFDIVLCYGVLYHINDPLSAMMDSFYVALDEILFEGVFFDNKEPLLWLFAPKECHDDPTNIYALSTAYLIKVAELCGFELVEIKWPRYAATRWHRWKRKVRPGYDRATLRFRRVNEKTPGYKKECFSLVPKALK